MTGIASILLGHRTPLALGALGDRRSVSVPSEPAVTEPGPGLKICVLRLKLALRVFSLFWDDETSPRIHYLWRP
jgi:hypothetical protein